eukprot:scaffold655_cov225-Pinguiococcus_pyrenoidosus.AAC.10
MAKLLFVVLAALVLALASAFVAPKAGVTSVRSVSNGRRGPTIVMDGKSNAIRDRIKSVKNTKKITEAMRLVAAAKVRPFEPQIRAKSAGEAGAAAMAATYPTPVPAHPRVI